LVTGAQQGIGRTMAIAFAAAGADIAQTQGARRESDRRVRWAARFRSGEGGFKGLPFVDPDSP
jgi:NAD(P)-dependent dehydrogenase (short-subunit alcohol dehydrogenase family)